jgi:hypothetical protein
MYLPGINPYFSRCSGAARRATSALLQVSSLVVVLDDLRVSDDFRGKECRESFRDKIVGSSKPVPFFALSFQAINVNERRSSYQSREDGEDAVGSIAEEDDVITAEERMKNG